MKHYAIFSLNDTRDIERFAAILNAAGWTVIATDKPYEVLEKAGADTVLIQDYVGMKDYGYVFPPTLHSRIEYGLTFDDPEERIELVYNITYGLETGNDVGGHALLALAAKGGRIPVASYEDMCRVVDSIEKEGEVPPALRQELINSTNYKVACHYAELLKGAGGDMHEVLTFRRHRRLLNGENPYQVPCDLMEDEDDDPLALCRFEQAAGNVPCFTNMADLDCVLETLCKAHLAFAGLRGRAPHITIAAKHGNACGIGVSWDDPVESVRRALWGDPMAIWGGEVIMNFDIDQAVAAELYASERRKEACGSGKWMLDVIAAPAVADEGLAILSQRKNTKVFINRQLRDPGLTVPGSHLRPVRGGAIREPWPSYVLALDGAQWVGSPLDGEELDALIIAWACAFTSAHGGNEVAIARDGCLLGVGGGPSTVEAARVAVRRCNENGNTAQGAFFGADAFFPFTDAPQILVDAGCKGGVVPGGGMREQDVKDYFADRNAAVVFLGENIRGFCRH